MEYSNIYTIDDFYKETGYNLVADGRLELGDFTSNEEAAAVFMQDAFDELVDLIGSKRGIVWTSNFLTDITDSDTLEDVEILNYMLEGLKKAFKTHLLYRYEVGDYRAMGSTERPQFNQNTIDTLISYRILPMGY